jgi:hypothetical protein
MGLIFLKTGVEVLIGKLPRVETRGFSFVILTYFAGSVGVNRRRHGELLVGEASCKFFMLPVVTKN